MSIPLKCRAIVTAIALVGFVGAAPAQTSPEQSPAAAPCPKGYEALCKAFGSSGAGSADIGSQAGTGGKSTAFVRPEVLENDVALKEIYARFSPSIFQIEVVTSGLDANQSKINKGTGFYIGNEGYAITSAHLFTDSSASTKVSVMSNPYAVQLVASIVSVLRDTDLALIKIAIPVAQVPGINGRGMAAVGERVSILGFRFDSGPYLTLVTGLVSSLEGGPRGDFLVTASVSPGMAGSPVLGANGELIGVVSGGSVSGAIGVPIQYARPLFLTAGIP